MERPLSYQLSLAMSSLETTNAIYRRPSLVRNAVNNILRRWATLIWSLICNHEDGAECWRRDKSRMRKIVEMKHLILTKFNALRIQKFIVQFLFIWMTKILLSVRLEARASDLIWLCITQSTHSIYNTSLSHFFSKWWLTVICQECNVITYKLTISR